jgi:SAM-dependent methyltransferase
MQVFEHLHDPHGSMQEIARILKNGGMLYLALPNAASVWRKVFGKNWVSGWFAPFHLFFYNRDMLAKMAAAYGFDVIESWSSTPESWFRLNLKAYLYPKENQLEWRLIWLDNMPIRLVLMAFLRIVELPLCQRDCLVIKFQKRS